MGDMGWAFIPAGTGIQHPATSAHNTAPPHKGAHGQSRGGGRIGGGCDPSLAPWNISPWPPTEQKTTKGNCSVKAVQGPSGNAEKGTQEFGLPGPYPDQGKKSHKSCQQPAPLLSQGPQQDAPLYRAPPQPGPQGVGKSSPDCPAHAIPSAPVSSGLSRSPRRARRRDQPEFGCP